MRFGLAFVLVVGLVIVVLVAIMYLSASGHLSGRSSGSAGDHFSPRDPGDHPGS
jgi:hypothetical protein